MLADRPSTPWIATPSAEAFQLVFRIWGCPWRWPVPSKGRRMGGEWVEELKQGDNFSACLSSYRALSGKGNNKKSGLWDGCELLWDPMISRTPAAHAPFWNSCSAVSTMGAWAKVAGWPVHGPHILVEKVPLWRDLQNLFHSVTEFLSAFQVENNVLQKRLLKKPGASPKTHLIWSQVCSYYVLMKNQPLSTSHQQLAEEVPKPSQAQDRYLDGLLALCSEPRYHLTKVQYLVLILWSPLSQSPVESTAQSTPPRIPHRTAV